MGEIEREEKRRKKQETCTSNRVYAKSNRCNTPGAYSFLFNFSPICSFVPKFFRFQLVLFLFMLVVVVYIWPNIFWIVCSDSGTKVENVMFEMEEQQNSNIFEIELRFVSPFCLPFAKREICCFCCCNFRLCRCFSYLFFKLIAFCEFTWIFSNKLNSIKRNWWNRSLWPRKLSTTIMIQIETQTIGTINPIWNHQPWQIRARALSHHLKDNYPIWYSLWRKFLCVAICCRQSGRNVH